MQRKGIKRWRTLKASLNPEQLTTIDPRFGSYYFDIVMWGGDQQTLTTWSVQHPIYHNVTRIDNRLSIFTVKTKYLQKNATLRTVQQDFV